MKNYVYMRRIEDMFLEDGPEQKLLPNVINRGKKYVKDKKIWEDLTNAIITQACEDYRDAKRVLVKKPKDLESRTAIVEIEGFFRSDWFAIMSEMDCEWLIKRLRVESVKCEI